MTADDDLDDGRDFGPLDWPDKAWRVSTTVAGEHTRLVLVLATIVGIVIAAGFVDIPEMPVWAPVLLVSAGAAALGGHLVGKLILADIEPDWQYIVQVNADNPATPVVHKVTPAVIEDMTVIGGRRLTSPAGLPTYYVCRYFNQNPYEPVAHTTWADVPADSEILGVKPSSIEDEVVALRDTYEETHGQYRWVLDHLYMVVRRLDFRRSETQNAVLEDHLTPSMSEDSVSDVVDDVIPAELRPDRHDGPDLDDDPATFEEAVEAAVEETVDDAGPETASSAAETHTAATDGGANE